MRSENCVNTIAFTRKFYTAREVGKMLMLGCPNIYGFEPHHQPSFVGPKCINKGIRFFFFF